MRKLFALSFAVCASLLVLATYADARTSAVWNATLTTSDMVPAVKGSSGSGTFQASLRGYQLSFKLTFAHLSGPAIGASLGFGPKGQAGHLTIPLCAPCKSPVSTGAGVDKSLITALREHLLFVVVRTAKHPNGEIRGQIVG